MTRDDAINTPPANSPIDETAQAVAADEVTGNEAEERLIPRVGAGFTAVYGFTYFGFYLVLFMPALFSVAYKVQLLDPASKEANLGLIIGVGALASAVFGPVIGVFSDGTRLAWGRRRPYLLLGLILAGVSATVIALAPNIVIVLLGWIVAQVATSTISAAVNPTLPERVPPSQRGRLGAIGGVAASIAGVFATLVGSFLTSNLLLLFLVPVGVFAVGVVLWLLVIPDAPAPAAVASRSALGALRSLIFDPRKHRDFAWVWIGKFCLQVGTAFFTTYQLYFLLDRLGYTPEEAGRQLAAAGGVALLATIGFTIGGGFISDRLRRRKPFIYIAAGMIAAGMVVAAIAPDFLTYVIGGTLLAAGTGAFNSVDLAFAADVLPDKAESGKWMSIYHLSGSLSNAVGPALAPALLLIGSTGANYMVLFIAGGALALGAAITAARVRGAR